jgi:hypothetical protein
MTRMNRRRFVTSMIATAACAAAVPGGAVFAAASAPAACANRLPLLIAAGHPIGQIAPGWKPIVAAALEIMTAIDPEVEIRQIKQKFGGLRIYYGSHRYDELELVVNQAKILCERTCEECGEAGSLFNQNGCIRTLCEEHQVVTSLQT